MPSSNKKSNKTSSKEASSSSKTSQKLAKKHSNEDTSSDDNASVELLEDKTNGHTDKGSKSTRTVTKLRQLYGNDKEMILSSFCPSITSVSDNSDLDVDALVEDLLKYARVYHKWNSSTLSLHSFSNLFQALWVYISSNAVRNMLKSAVIDQFYDLDSDSRQWFEPILDKVKELSPHSSVSDVINRRRLIALDSKQIPMSGGQLDSNTTPMELATFKESMGRCLDTRTNWRRVLIIRVPDTKRDQESKDSNSKTKTVPKNVLTEFRAIAIGQLVRYNFHRSESLQDASLSMYEALTNTMTIRFRGEMRLYNDKTTNEGPKLLFFILRKLTMKDSRIVVDLQLEIPTFESTFKDTGYDVHLVCPSIHDRLQQYQCAGGNPETHYNVLCTGLISMHCDALTSAVREWEQKQMRKFNKKSIFDLLQKLPLLVDNLISDGTWPYKSSTGNRTLAAHFKALQAASPSSATAPAAVTSNDLTAFKGKVEEMIKSSSSKTASKALKAFIAHKNDRPRTHGSSNSGLPGNPSTAVTRNKHSFNINKWGPDKHYRTKEEFSMFFNGKIPNMDLTRSYDYEGLTWYWCSKCDRMGNHPTKRHRDRGNKRRRGDRDSPSNVTAPPASAAFNADHDVSGAGPANVDSSNSFDPDIADISNLLDNIDSDDDISEIENN